MKKYITIIAALIITISGVKAQNVNWNSLGDSKSKAAYLNFGYEYGLTTQLGYIYKLNTSIPVLINADFSSLLGENLIDDFKVRYGGQIELINKSNFVVSGKALAIFRRLGTDNVRIVNFGSDFGITAGYYKPKWFLAGEFGFDKAISSHLKHTEAMKEIYPTITDGWYVPSGGQYYYGIQTGLTLNIIDISFKAGLTNAQGEDENALLPYYAQLGIMKRF